MLENIDRLSHPKMEYYRHVYKNSERWNGSDSIEDKTVVVYCEEGFGDIIQFSRYFPLLKNKCRNVILHCPKQLHRLFSQFGLETVDKFDEQIPDHDYHVCSMSLPFVLNQIDAPVPYLSIDEVEQEICDLDGTKIGIAWEGNPFHSNNNERNCPLRYFSVLNKLPNAKLFMLQKDIHIPELVKGADSMNISTIEIDDFYDTAKLINSLDFVVSVDTSVIHLSGAMGVPTFVMLSKNHDPRWEVYDWYPKTKFLKQNDDFDWSDNFKTLLKHLSSR